MFRFIIFTVLSFAFTFNAIAGVTYDVESNTVFLTNPMLTEFNGLVKIYNEKHISISAVGYIAKSDKIIEMCGKEPTLGILILEGKVSLDKFPPKVTEVEKYSHPSYKEVTEAGYVSNFVLKGEDALDLMDLFYEYESVGFILTEKCPDVGDTTSGKIIINFNTRGIVRAMRSLTNNAMMKNMMKRIK
jgi:hypothetical protein